MLSSSYKEVELLESVSVNKVRVFLTSGSSPSSSTIFVGTGFMSKARSISPYLTAVLRKLLVIA
jgi:hypothetical protein